MKISLLVKSNNTKLEIKIGRDYRMPNKNLQNLCFDAVRISYEFEGKGKDKN